MLKVKLNCYLPLASGPAYRGQVVELEVGYARRLIEDGNATEVTDAVEHRQAEKPGDNPGAVKAKK